MRMEAWEELTGQPLTDDYWKQSERAEPFFEGHPLRKEAWRQRADWLDAEVSPRADRRALTEALRRFNERAGSGPRAMRHIGLLDDAQTLCVVGGQQAALFTGPLLVIYKAITLIRTAKELSEQLGRPVVPVFWIAGEDHDYDEVNHLYTLTADSRLARIRLEHPTGARTAVSRLQLTPEHWRQALEQLDESLAPTDFKDGIMERLRSIAHRSDTLVDSFAQCLTWLLGDCGLVLVDSDDPNIRNLEGAMFQQLIERNDALGDALLQGKRQLEQAGYEAQADISEQSAHLFVFDGQERVLLYKEEQGGFTDRKGSRRYTRQQLLDWAQSAPERLSNNVMTRPLMQEYLFPVLATVLGPSETAYWGLTKSSFECFGMRMPIIVPRLGFTLVEGTVQKNMTKYQLTIRDAMIRLEECQSRWLDEQDTMQLGLRFEQVRERFLELYEPLLQDVAGINPGLGKLGAVNKDKIIEQIRFMEQKAVDASQAQFAAALRQFARIGISLKPDGKPQERVLNIMSFLNKFGEEWLGGLVQELTAAPLDKEATHYIYYL